VPEDIKRRILYSDDPGTTLYGACPFAGGRVLLVFRAFAVIAGPGGTTLSRVTPEPTGRPRLLGTTPGGLIAACDEKEGFKEREGFVKIPSNPRHLHPPGSDSRKGDAEEGFISVTSDGTQLLARCGGHDEMLLYDASSDPGIARDALNRRVLHWAIHNENTWVAIVIVAHRRESADLTTSESEDPTRHDLRIVGRVEGQVFGWTLTDVERNYRDLYPRIAAFTHGLLGIVRDADLPDHGPGIMPYDPRQHRVGEVVPFDLLAHLKSGSGLDPSNPSIRVGTEEDRYYPPLVEVSPEWTLIRGPLTNDTMPWTEEAVFTVYQYHVGSLAAPTVIEGMTLGGRTLVLETSPERADLLDLRRNGARTYGQLRQLHIDSDFGVRLASRHTPVTDFGTSVCGVTALDPGHVVVSYDSVPFRVEVQSLWRSPEEDLPPPVAIGYLSSPPKQVLLSRGERGAYLVVATESHVIWFDLNEVPLF
jgi:hypothetical protein